MDVRPRRSDQPDLDREKRQPTDEGYGVKVHDQRVVQPVLAHVVEAVGAEARQNSHPDQRREKKKGVSIRAGPRGKTL